MSKEDLFVDEQFEQLSARLNAPNIFVCTDISGIEIRHSNFIAWLLDIRGSHNQKSLFFDRFLQSWSDHRLKQPNSFSLKREKDNIDLLIEYDSNVIAIENKIRAKDSKGQLSKYSQIIASKFKNKNIHKIYWTLHGDDPLDADEGKHWTRYSYQKFLGVLSSLTSEINDEKVAIYVRDYIDALNINYIQDSEYARGAKALVDKHKLALSKIFTNPNAYPSEHINVLRFLERHSSFSRGEGFFSVDKPFRRIFSNVCLRHGYSPIAQGDKQSTYFNFHLNNIDGCLKIFGIICRFYENRGVLSFRFTLDPETASNKKLRDLILNNLNAFNKMDVVSRRGKKHVGVVKKDVAFNPMLLGHQSLDQEIDSIFDREINPFSTQVSTILQDLVHSESAPFP